MKQGNIRLVRNPYSFMIEVGEYFDKHGLYAVQAKYPDMDRSTLLEARERYRQHMMGQQQSYENEAIEAVSSGFKPLEEKPPAAEKYKLKGKHRSEDEKIEILAHMEKHGRESTEKEYGVNYTQLYAWAYKLGISWKDRRTKVLPLPEPQPVEPEPPPEENPLAAKQQRLISGEDVNYKEELELESEDMAKKKAGKDFTTDQRKEVVLYCKNHGPTATLKKFGLSSACYIYQWRKQFEIEWPNKAFSEPPEEVTSAIKKRRSYEEKKEIYDFFTRNDRTATSAKYGVVSSVLSKIVKDFAGTEGTKEYETPSDTKPKKIIYQAVKIEDPEPEAEQAAKPKSRVIVMVCDDPAQLAEMLKGLK